MRAYLGCNCAQCRFVRRKSHKYHKRYAHRALRRLEKMAIRRGEEPPKTFYAGYAS